MRVVLLVLFFLGLTWGGCSNLFAMVTIENDGVLLYFPEGEAAIAARLNQNLADILMCTKPLRGSFSPRFYNGFEPNCFFEFICSFFDRGGKFPLYRYK